METKDSPRLTISREDADYPARFTGPHGTITCEVNEDVLSVYVRPEARAADWDMARALCRAIADPAHSFGQIPSVLGSVDWCQIPLAV
jgi:hypothetical protein